MRFKLTIAGAAALGGIAFMMAPTAGSASTSGQGVPRYQHIVEIIMENTSYSTIIGNPLAPQLNAMANKYGLATDYFGVTHPSEPNYVANVGGSFFGIQDDNQFYCTPALANSDPTCAGTTVNHTISAPSIADQLTAAGKTWRGYFQSLPPIPSSGVVMTGPNANGPYAFKWPSNTDALYASKHNPFVNFTGTQTDLANMVPDTQLGADLATGHLPNLGTLVSEIMHSRVWDQGQNAIVITWDEDDFSDSGQTGTGCCGADPGGGHVVTIVINNNQPKHVVYNTPSNHYSLLLTFEDAFGLPCLQGACDKAHGVVPMTPLFRTNS